MSFLERIAQRALDAPPAAPARPADGGLMSGQQTLRAAAPEVEEEPDTAQRAAAETEEPEEPEAQRQIGQQIRRQPEEEEEEEEVQRAAVDIEMEKPEDAAAQRRLRRQAGEEENQEEEVQRAAADEEAEDEEVQRAAAPPPTDMPDEEEEPSVQRRLGPAVRRKHVEGAAAAPRLARLSLRDGAPPASAPAVGGGDRVGAPGRFATPAPGDALADAAPGRLASESGAPALDGPPRLQAPAEGPPDKPAGHGAVPQDTLAAPDFDPRALVPNATLDALLAAAQETQPAEDPTPDRSAAADTPLETPRPQVTIERLDVFVAEPPPHPQRPAARRGAPRTDTRYLKGL